MTKLDELAEKAYQTMWYAKGGPGETAWYDLDEDEREAWREVVRVVVREAAAANALSVLEGAGR
jgi:hypothetical protein